MKLALTIKKYLDQILVRVQIDFSQMNKLNESNNHYNELKMIQDLVSTNGLLSHLIREKIGGESEYNDLATADLRTA